MSLGCVSGMANTNTPVTGGNLTVVFSEQNPGSMYIAVGTDVAPPSISRLFDTLIAINELNLTFHPGLAKSWEIAPDGKSITLHLRKDVTFHDGSPFNAQAVKYNFDAIATRPECKGKAAYSMLGVGKFYEGCEVLDDYTVRLSWSKFIANMLPLLSTPVYSMNSPIAMEKYGSNYGKNNVVGTGPFIFVRYTGLRGEVVYRRNPNYNWAPEFYQHQGPPYLDTVTWKVIGEDTTRASALKSGTADVAIVSGLDFAYFDKAPNFKILPIPPISGGGWAYNLAHPIVQDLRVRQAISYALNKEAMLDSPVYNGYGEIAYCDISAAMWGESPEQYKETFDKYNRGYNPDESRALLEEVGWKDTNGDGIREAHGVKGVADGTELVLDCPTETGGVYLEESVLVAGMLANVGIKLNIHMCDFAARETRMFDGDFDFASWAGAWDWYSLTMDLYTNATYNVQNYSSPEYDAAVDGIMATTDPAKQREYLKKAMIAVLKDIPREPMIFKYNKWVSSDKVEGIRPAPVSTDVDFYDTWINPNP